MKFSDVITMTVDNIGHWFPILLSIRPSTHDLIADQSIHYVVKSTEKNNQWDSFKQLTPKDRETLKMLWDSKTQSFDWQTAVDAYQYLTFIVKVITLAEKMLNFEEVTDDLFDTALCFNTDSFILDQDFIQEMKQLRQIIENEKKYDRLIPEEHKMQIYAKLIVKILDLYVPVDEIEFNNLVFRRFLLACLGGSDGFLNIYYTESALLSLAKHVEHIKNELNCIMVANDKNFPVKSQSYDVIDILNAVSLAALLRVLFAKNKPEEVNGISNMLTAAINKLNVPSEVSAATRCNENNQVSERVLMVGKIGAYFATLRSKLTCESFLYEQLKSYYKIMSQNSTRFSRLYPKEESILNIQVLSLYKTFLNDMAIQAYMIGSVGLFSELIEKLKGLEKTSSTQDLMHLAKLLHSVTTILEDKSKGIDLAPVFVNFFDKNVVCAESSNLNIHIIMAYRWLLHYRNSNDIKILENACIHLFKIAHLPENNKSISLIRMLSIKIEEWFNEINFAEVIKVHFASLLKEYQLYIETSIENIEKMRMPLHCKTMAINHLESFHAASIQWRSDLCLCDSLDQVIGLLKNFRECKKAETKDIKTFVQGKVHIEMIALLYPADERNQLRPPSPRKVSQIQSRYDRTFWTTNQPRILRSRSNPEEIPPLAHETNTKYKVRGKVR